MKDEKYYTELDQQLRNLAINDWVTFYNLIGIDAIIAAKICMLRTREKSLGRIAIQLDVSKRKAQLVTENKCNCSNINKQSINSNM